MYKAYVDGRSENGKGAWAFMVLDESDNIIGGLSGHEQNDSGNLMGLIGAIHMFNYFSEKGFEGESIEIYTDSSYLRRGITEWIEGWMAPNEKGQTWMGARGKPIKHKELWMKLYNHTLKYTLNWDWVMSSVGDKYNERITPKMKETRLKVSNLIQTEMDYEEKPIDTDVELSVDDVLDYMFGNESNPASEQKSISKIEGTKPKKDSEDYPWDGILMHPIKSLYDRFYEISAGRGFIFEKMQIDLHWVEVTLECDPSNPHSISNAAQDTYQILRDIYKEKMQDNSIQINEIRIEDETIKCVIWGSVQMNYDSLSPQEYEYEELKREVNNVGRT